MHLFASFKGGNHKTAQPTQCMGTAIKIKPNGEDLALDQEMITRLLDECGGDSIAMHEVLQNFAMGNSSCKN